MTLECRAKRFMDKMVAKGYCSGLGVTDEDVGPTNRPVPASIL